MSELVDRANAEMQPEANTKSLIRTLPTKTMNELLDLIAELEPFKTMLIEALIVSHIYSSEHETDAKKALYDLIGWEVKIALDPQVSSDAEALIQKGRDESNTERAFTEGYRAEVVQQELLLGGDKCTSCGEWKSRCICEEEDE